MEQEDKNKAINVVEDERYQFMARLALKLYGCEHDEHIWISFDSLKYIMKDHEHEYSEGGNRGIAASVSTAQTYYGQAREDTENENEKKSLEYIRHAIAVSFRNKDGEISYDHEKPDHKIKLKE